MGLKYVVESLEQVEEASRPLYVEKDGKFYLDVEGLEDTEDLKRSLRDANKEAAERRRLLEGWKKVGKTPDEIQELLEAHRVAEEEKHKKAGDWDKLREQMNEAHAKALKEKDAALDKMKASLENHLVVAEATRALSEAKGSPALLLPHVRASVRVVEKDGQFGVQVVDAKGDLRVNSKGDPISIPDLVSEMRESEVFGRAFDGSGRSGSGTPPNAGAGRSGGNRTMNRADFDKLDPVAQMKAMTGPETERITVVD